jgi:hypothetical protein
MNAKVILAVCFVSVLLSGCVQMTMGPHQATLQNIDLLKKPEISPMNVGSFGLAQGKDPAVNVNVSIRGSTLSPANGALLSDYLKDAVTTELKAAGKYESSSNLIVKGLLTESQVDAPIGTGTGSLGANFTMTRSGKVVYDRTHQVNAAWPSAFIGAEAIPTAVNEYTSLFKKLITRLFEDKEFQMAAAKK